VDLPVFIISLHRRFCASSNFQLLNCSEALWLRYSFQYFIFHLLDTLYSLWGAQLRTSHQALSFIWKYTLDPVSWEQRFNIIYVWPLGSNIIKERENSIFFDSFFHAPLGSFLIDPHKWLVWRPNPNSASIALYMIPCNPKQYCLWRTWFSQWTILALRRSYALVCHYNIVPPF
jgi:hypothetical protein